MSCLNCCEEVDIFAILGDYQITGPYINIKIIIMNIFNHYYLSYNMKFKYQLALIVIATLTVVAMSDCSNSEEFLVSFHPHLDAFWLDTDDDLKNINFTPAGFLYAMNQRNSKTIFNSMYDALVENSSRKYFVSEIVFFKDWYDYISADKRARVKLLILSGQLEIANGGWVQNDEAVCYMDDILDQYTLGNNFLQSQFGVETKIGWATDSFGHSHSQVALEHLLGFQFQGIQRIDDRYIYQRTGGPLLQFYWSPVSDSNNRKYGGIVTYIRHFLHEVNDLRRENPKSIQPDFKRVQQNMKKLYKNNKFFRFLGNDFEEFVSDQFSKLQGAFALLNRDSQQCPIFKYGNPTDYLNRIKDIYGENAPIREHDLMPNFDQDHYWSGYYTTDPELKKICKDFSKLVNLFRKIYIKHLTVGKRVNQKYATLLNKADELLSVMQHHDGITATSKYHIETLFKNRMKEMTNQLIGLISEIKNISEKICKLYEGNCIFDSKEDIVYLTILHEGAQKKERVQLFLPKDIAYDLTDDNTDNIFCNPKNGICTLVFDAHLKSGENYYKLNKVGKEGAVTSVKIENNYKDVDFEITVANGQIKYAFLDNFVTLSLVKSANRQTNTRTYTWDKYGNKMQKNENRIPGIYIMSNDGKLASLDIVFNNIYFAKGSSYTKIYLTSLTNDITLTIKNKEINVVEVQTFFKPQTREMFDYFLKISSNINSKGQFFHDMNGYLVAKRKIGERPDYKWEYKIQDKINANTYPMCSFAYAIQGEKKLVVFTDRAQGITQYDESFLINIDRLTGDDYKGVGEGYSYQIQNTFKHKIAIVDKKSFVERQWQRNFDQALLGFYSSNEKKVANLPDIVPSNIQKFLKYSIFVLNHQEYVLRLFNLGENQNIKVPIHSKIGWNISDIGLHLQFKDIRESFANGIVLGERKMWHKIEREINIFNAGSQDTLEEITLAPLQIRSFRINRDQTISSSSPTESNPLQSLSLTNIQPVAKPFTKRCF